MAVALNLMKALPDAEYGEDEGVKDEGDRRCWSSSSSPPSRGSTAPARGNEASEEGR